MTYKANPQQLLENAQLIHSPEVIDQAVARLSNEITAQLSNSLPIIICVMSGGIVFAGRLLPQLNFPLEIDYIHASRYQNKTVGKAVVWQSLPKLNLIGRTVLIVDDILDEGITLFEIRQKCLELGAVSVMSAVLAEKKLLHTKPIKAEFVGVDVPNAYVFGYGMDVYGWWRNLPAIYAIDQS